MVANKVNQKLYKAVPDPSYLCVSLWFIRCDMYTWGLLKSIIPAVSRH